mmetsp:Transcript_35282/g.76140  ORF Transcript_35282/g.76140 Transcript_35282/m.76140 type:complete len:224 (+) Transcript_35282:877-1548(+)
MLLVLLLQIVVDLQLFVSLLKFGSDHRHGEGNEHDACHHGQAAHDPTRERPGHLVTVANGGHGDHGPPKGGGDRSKIVGGSAAIAAEAAVPGPARGELCALLTILYVLRIRHIRSGRAPLGLGVINQRAEEHHPDAQKQRKDGQGPCRAHHRLRHDVHASGVLAQLEDPEDSDQPHCSEDLEGFDRLDILEEEDWNDRHQVDDISWSPQKLASRNIAEGIADK